MPLPAGALGSWAPLTAGRLGLTADPTQGTPVRPSAPRRRPASSFSSLFFSLGPGRAPFPFSLLLDLV